MTLASVNVGDVAPDFTVTADGDHPVNLSDFRGKTVVLYFYPKDDTPGCTKEACGFRDAQATLQARNAVVIGVSVDGGKSHARFKEKYALPFPLAADEDKTIVGRYGVWVEKRNYGKTYMGTERTTFVIDQRGKVAKVFRKVKVDGHVQAVLDAL